MIKEGSVALAGVAQLIGLCSPKILGLQVQSLVQAYAKGNQWFLSHIDVPLPLLLPLLFPLSKIKACSQVRIKKQKRRLYKGGNRDFPKVILWFLGFCLFHYFLPFSSFLPYFQGEFCSINQKLSRKHMQKINTIPIGFTVSFWQRPLFPCILLSDHRMAAFVQKSREKCHLQEKPKPILWHVLYLLVLCFSSTHHMKAII